MIGENVENIRQRIARACEHAGRKPEEITLVAVTKTFSAEFVRGAVQAGILDIGENFVQELRDKRAELHDEGIRWHFIGHLQTNKVKYIADWVFLVHSVDSLALGKEISKRAEQARRTIDILLEVNTTGEQSKFGLRPDAVIASVKGLSGLPNINVAGLMTIGPFLPDPEGSRPAFRLLRELRDAAVKQGFHLPHLSMGMTNDFEVAIGEGATLIRVGTAIFGKRSKQH